MKLNKKTIKRRKINIKMLEILTPCASILYLPNGKLCPKRYFN